VTEAKTLGIRTPVGILDITISRRAVHRAAFHGVRVRARPTKELEPLWERVRRQIEDYFSGKRKTFTLPLDPDPPGTAFQQAVWKALGEIPHGQVISYGDLARWAGRPGAARAAGAACGANRIPILIPCHRVVAKSGSLGGFGGGLEIKAALLRREHGA